MKTEEKEKLAIEKELQTPTIEAIKIDAQKEPDKYLKNYKIPAEGE